MNPTKELVEQHSTESDSCDSWLDLELPIVLLPDGMDVDSIADSSDSARGESEIGKLDSLDDAINDELAWELADQKAKRRLNNFRKWSHMLGATAIMSIPIILLIGLPYYILPLSARPHHPYHEALRPSGYIGLTLGALGLLTIIASMAYVVLKHSSRSVSSGSLNYWLNFHIGAGLLGPIMAFFHANFMPTSALGLLAMLSMGGILLSGIAGRYILTFVPKDLNGGELAFEDLRRRLVVYKRKLVKLGLRSAHLDASAKQVAKKQPWTIVAIYRVFVGDRNQRKEYKKLKAAVEEQASQLGKDAGMILILVRRLCAEHQWLIRYQEMHRLVSTWRFLHRWLAIIMATAVFYHVLVALRYSSFWGVQ